MGGFPKSWLGLGIRHWRRYPQVRQILILGFVTCPMNSLLNILASVSFSHIFHIDVYVYIKYFKYLIYYNKCWLVVRTPLKNDGVRQLG